jgi:hypothetical protein
VSELECRTGRRRGLLRDLGVNGIDGVEVDDDGVHLNVYFLTGVPDGLTEANFRLDGARGAPAPRVVQVLPEPAEHDDEQDSIRVRLDRAGDAHPYRLCLVEPDGRPYQGFDPRAGSAEFSFTQICAGDEDCAAGCACDSTADDTAAPRDYLALDFASFRRLLLDRLALVAPGWQERHVPDLHVTLVELLAYVADHLAYYQDAVATEAYLNTARRRISVRRHGRLVDYVLGEGTNARAFVVVSVDIDLDVDPVDLAFITGYPGVRPVGLPLSRPEVQAQPFGSYAEFRPLVAEHVRRLTFRPGHDEIRIHTWGDEECCLPQGATTVTLVDRPGDELHLGAGDFLLFEEVLGARTGRPGDADPRKRHVVRLVRAETGYDAATKEAVLQVWWDREDALPFALCVSALGPAPACRIIHDVTVARANVVLTDHGSTVIDDLPPVPAGPVVEGCEDVCAPGEVVRRAGRFRPRLPRPGLTHAEPLPPGGSATALRVRDPRTAVPALTLTDDAGKRWRCVPDLLSSGPDDRALVAEMDDDRVAWLRFGDDRSGEEPEPGAVFTAHYRVGNGTSGNVGAGAIRYLVLPGRDDRVVRVRNPMPAFGGTDPEPVPDAKLAIPDTFRLRRERAITADDYAELAQRIAGAEIQSAAADLVWTGSGYVAEVSLDPRGAATVRGTLERRVRDGLQLYRRMGHDVRVVVADVVAVRLEITVCLQPHAIQAHVVSALRDVLGSGRGGLFHPDRWTFGQPVDVSPIVAATVRVPGVISAEVTALARDGEQGSDAAARGSLPIGRWEIAQLATGQPAITPIGGR